jgi:hypothetical protein
MADWATANAAVAQATLRRDRLPQLALAVRTSAFAASSCLLLDELSLRARHPSQDRTTERNAVGFFSGPPATAFRDNQNSGENLKARACRTFGLRSAERVASAAHDSPRRTAAAGRRPGGGN